MRRRDGRLPVNMGCLMNAYRRPGIGGHDAVSVLRSVCARTREFCAFARPLGLCPISEGAWHQLITLRVVLQSGFSEYPSLTLANDPFDLNRACFTQLGKTCEKWYRAKAEIIVKLRRTRSFYCLSAAGERTRKSSFPKPRP
jgi:hypothetical protein